MEEKKCILIVEDERAIVEILKSISSARAVIR